MTKYLIVFKRNNCHALKIFSRQTPFITLRSSILDGLNVIKDPQAYWNYIVTFETMDGPIRPRRATVLMRMLKLGVCGTALFIMIAACLAVSILYHWHRNLTAYNRFTVMMMIICSMFVLVFYLSIVTSYTTASKLFTGLPQQDIEMVPIRLLTLLEIVLLGVFYVFIKTPILHEPSKTNFTNI